MVIRATDGTLWTIGMGEYDRNVICNPTPVLAPHSEEEDKLLEEARRENRENEFKIPVYIASAQSRLVKGHQRVHLLVEDSSSSSSGPFSSSSTSSRSSNSSPICTKVYDIVLHNYESYLLPVDVTVPLDQLPSTDMNVQYRIKHFATGWQHTVMVLENELE